MIKSKESQLNFFDITVDQLAFSTPDELCMILHTHCKKWVFQLEKGQNGYEHYQCRVSLLKKMRLSTAIKVLRPVFLKGTTGLSFHISPTTNTTVDLVDQDECNGHENLNNRGFSYVMKEDTRVDGPWSDQEWLAPLPLTRQLKYFMECELRPFQKKLMDLCKKNSGDRIIHYIIEEKGATGKSIMVEYLCYHRLAVQIPGLKSAEDIMQMCLCLGKNRSTYLIDLPRSMHKQNMFELYTGLESLKNGYAYDKRYSFRQMQIDRPNIICFSNHFPEIGAMSKDRWCLHRIVIPNGNLAETDLIHIPTEQYILESEVNKMCLDQNKTYETNLMKKYKECAKKIVGEKKWNNRSELVEAVKKLAEEEK